MKRLLRFLGWTERGKYRSTTLDAAEQRPAARGDD